MKLSQENKNEDFAEWAEKEDAKKKKAAEEAANAVEQSYEDFKKNLPAEGEKKPIKVSPYTTIKSPYEGESPNKKADTKSERVAIPAESFEEGKRIYETRRKGAGQPGIVSEVKKALTNILNSIGGQHAVVSNNTEFGIKPYEVMVNMNVAGKLAGDPNPSAEKFAVLKNIDSIIENAAYVGSGDYVLHGTKNQNVTRYDYFETEVNINGKPYVVAFDVEVVPGKNNYRTHKVLNEINLMETSAGETRPRRVAEDATPGLQGTNSALSVESSPRLDAQGTESSSLGDVPSPKTNIPQNGNAVNNKKQANFEKAVQKKAPGVFAPGAFVQLLKVKELFLAFHFCIALAAINRTILSGFERNFCFAAAGSAGGGVHFFLGFDFVFACIAALFATLGLVNEAALCIEFLFAGGESELFSAFFAH